MMGIRDIMLSGVVRGFRPLRAMGCLAIAAGCSTAQDLGLSFSGVGWVQYGQISKSSDTTQNNYNGNSTQNSGAQILINARINPSLSGSVGLGVFESHALAGQISGGGRVPIGAGPYIAQANFTYQRGQETGFAWQLTGGYFSYNYNPEIKDLGLYLLRGPVYPGYILSGFETKEVLPIANTLGTLFRADIGRFRSDLLLFSETEFKPYFDFSLAWIGRIDLGAMGTLGLGANFYRLLPVDRRLSHDPYLVTKEQQGEIANPLRREFIYVDSSSYNPLVAGSSPDTTKLGFDGTKVMAYYTLDLKRLFGIEGVLGKEDLKLYTELCVIGLDMDKAHKDLYGDWKQRMPVMVGFNIPAFGLLDHVSLEAEWYGSEYRNDIWRLVRDDERPVSPIPFSYSDARVRHTRDNVKWALHAAKIFQGHFQVSAQVANDHFRPFGTTNNASYETAFSTPQDWYWMTKIAYWF